MHPEQNDSIMVITKQVQEILDATPPGKVLTIADFNVLPEYQPALVKALSRLWPRCGNGFGEAGPGL